ncbi:MAG: DUF3995 domain-containing protein [Roseibium sp.]
MVSALACALFGILTLVSGVHLYWGFGGLWPAKSELELARTVVGANGIETMPSAALTVVVAVLIFAASLLPLAWTHLLPLPDLVPSVLVFAGMIALTGVFLLRGLIGFTPYFAKMNAEEPFRTLDRKYFSPLCLILGIGFLALTIV